MSPNRAAVPSDGRHHAHAVRDNEGGTERATRTPETSGAPHCRAAGQSSGCAPLVPPCTLGSCSLTPRIIANASDHWGSPSEAPLNTRYESASPRGRVLRPGLSHLAADLRHRHRFSAGRPDWWQRRCVIGAARTDRARRKDQHYHRLEVELRGSQRVGGSEPELDKWFTASSVPPCSLVVCSHNEPDSDGERPATFRHRSGSALSEGVLHTSPENVRRPHLWFQGCAGLVAAAGPLPNVTRMLVVMSTSCWFWSGPSRCVFHVWVPVSMTPAPLGAV